MILKRLVTSSPQYGYRYLIKGKEVISSPQFGYRYLIKGSYIPSTVWIRIFDKSKDWCYLSILYYNARKRNFYSIIMDVALVIEAAE